MLINLALNIKFYFECQFWNQFLYIWMKSGWILSSNNTSTLIFFWNFFWNISKRTNYSACKNCPSEGNSAHFHWCGFSFMYFALSCLLLIVFRAATANLSQERPNILPQIFFDRLFLIRVYWNPKFRQGPDIGGLSSCGGPGIVNVLKENKQTNKWW